MAVASVGEIEWPRVQPNADVTGQYLCETSQMRLRVASGLHELNKSCLACLNVGIRQPTRLGASGPSGENWAREATKRFKYNSLPGLRGFEPSNVGVALASRMALARSQSGAVLRRRRPNATKPSRRVNHRMVELQRPTNHLAPSPTTTNGAQKAG